MDSLRFSTFLDSLEANYHCFLFESLNPQAIENTYFLFSFIAIALKFIPLLLRKLKGEKKEDKSPSFSFVKRNYFILYFALTWIETIVSPFGGSNMKRIGMTVDQIRIFNISVNFVMFFGSFFLSDVIRIFGYVGTCIVISCCFGLQFLIQLFPYNFTTAIFAAIFKGLGNSWNRVAFDDYLLDATANIPTTPTMFAHVVEEKGFIRLLISVVMSKVSYYIFVHHGLKAVITITCFSYFFSALVVFVLLYGKNLKPKKADIHQENQKSDNKTEQKNNNENKPENKTEDKVDNKIENKAENNENKTEKDKKKQKKVLTRKESLMTVLKSDNQRLIPFLYTHLVWMMVNLVIKPFWRHFLDENGVKYPVPSVFAIFTISIVFGTYIVSFLLKYISSDVLFIIFYCIAAALMFNAYVFFRFKTIVLISCILFEFIDGYITSLDTSYSKEIPKECRSQITSMLKMIFTLISNIFIYATKFYGSEVLLLLYSIALFSASFAGVRISRAQPLSEPKIKID